MKAKVTGVAAARRRLVVAVAGATLVAVPLVSLGAVATARTGRPDSATRTCTAGSYTVLSGDSWARISTKLHVTMTALLRANGATSGMVIHPGDVLCTPAGAAASPAAATSTTAAPATATTGKPAAPLAPLAPTAIRQFPVQGTCWFTDSYGAPRSGGRSHEGVDIIAKTGQYVYAADDGTLTKQYIDAPGKLPGNGWRITRADGTYFFYGHLSTFAPGLAVGSKVVAGQIIGRVGMTGNAGVPHLHFEVHPGGGPSVDPTPIVAAVNGCTTTVVPAQPGAAPAETTPATPEPATSVPATPAPATPEPPTTVPGAASSPVAAATPTRWQFVNPVTVFDSGGRRMVPGRDVSVSLARARSVPATTTGVLVRIAARNVTGGGYVAVRSCTGATPITSLTFAPGQPNATTTVVPVTAGSFCVLASAKVDVRIAVVAYQTTQPAAGVGMQAVPSRRALDTRPAKPLAARTTRGVSLAALGAPAGTVAATVTVTVLGATSGGSVGLGACSGAPWMFSFAAKPVLVFSGVVPVGSSGLCITSTVTVHLVVDVTGTWSPSATGALLGAVTPMRVYDSRAGAPVPDAGVQVPLGLVAGVTRAQLTVTAIAGPGGGTVRMVNCADSAVGGVLMVVPAGAVLSVTAGMNVAGGTVCVAASPAVHVVIDVTAIG